MSFWSKKPQAPLPPDEDPNALGNLAVELGFITDDDLKVAVSTQAKKLPLGQILMDMGKLTECQLEEVLLAQKIRRGEITDPAVLLRYEHLRKRSKVLQVQRKFRELGKDARAVSTGLFEAAQAVRAK